MDILLLGITDPNLTIDLKYQYISYMKKKLLKIVRLCSVIYSGRPSISPLFFYVQD